MLPCDFPESGVPLVSMEGGEIIIIGFLPDICNVGLDYRGTNNGRPIPGSDPVVGIIHYSTVTAEITFTPLANHTRVLMDGREIDYETAVPVYPGTLFVIGMEPYETRFLITPAVLLKPVTQEEFLRERYGEVESSWQPSTDWEKRNLRRQKETSTFKHPDCTRG